MQEFFDDNALFSVEIDGCGEKQRYGKFSGLNSYCFSYTRSVFILPILHGSRTLTYSVTYPYKDRPLVE